MSTDAPAGNDPPGARRPIPFVGVKDGTVRREQTFWFVTTAGGYEEHVCTDIVRQRHAEPGLEPRGVRVTAPDNSFDPEHIRITKEAALEEALRRLQHLVRDHTAGVGECESRLREVESLLDQERLARAEQNPAAAGQGELAT